MKGILEAFDNTSICTFVYYPQKKEIYVPEKTCNQYKWNPQYRDMPKSFAKDFVHPRDYDVFETMYYRIDSGVDSASSEFHSKDYQYCLRVTLTTVNRDEQDRPTEVFGVVEDISDLFIRENLVQQLKTKLEMETDGTNEMQEVMNSIASTISEQYYAIYYIWMNTKSYVCFQEQLPGILSVIGAKGKYQPAWDNYIRNYIEAEDQNKMYEFSDINTLAQRLQSSNSIMQVYRRKGLGWTRGMFLVAKRDSEGNVTNVIYTVSDINEEMLQKMKQKQAVFEALHDPLTMVLNRKGFAQCVTNLQKENPRNEKQLIGFALIDIDNFKMINDTYGHDFGDRVLIRVAKFLSETFHSEDRIFRFGGDEFGVLLKNCTADVWDIICKKLEYVHNTLKKAYPNHNSITLSAGLCFSENGYSEELFALADEALYETKHNGRAGCTLIDREHNVLKSWKNNPKSVLIENALVRSNTGLYRMEFPHNSNEKPRMICNETTKTLLGLSFNASPEECYRIWINGIDPSYMETLWETRNMMISGLQAECAYQWNHSKWGNIYIRSGGYGEVTTEMDILNGYHHVLKDTEIVERKDNSQKIVDAMKGMFFATYLFFASTFWTKLQNIFGHCCMSKLDKVAKPWLALYLDQPVDALQTF